MFAMPIGRLIAEPSQPVPSAGPASAALNQLLDAFMDEQLRRSPEQATSLGLDKGALAAAKSQLDDRSLAARDRDKRDNADRPMRLKTIDRAALSGMDAVNYDTVAFVIETQAEADRRYDYGAPDGVNGAGFPYTISQLTGSYQSVPDFLDSQHRIESKADAEAYLSRLDAFATILDQEIEVARHDAALGVLPPDFALVKAQTQMRALRDQGPDKSVLVQSLVRRCGERGISGDWDAKAAAIYTTGTRPALDRQIALVQEQRAKTNSDAGVWKLPDGGAYYADSLKNWTTIAMAPEEIHRTGLKLVDELTRRIGEVMKANGLTEDTVGKRLRGMFENPKFRYPNTDEGKAKLIDDLNRKVQDMQARLPAYFRTLPKARLEIRRIPKYTEAGAAAGYYTWPALDGSRPGAYYINLRDTAELPGWTLPTLTYHEGIPGHHLQISLQQEADLPLIRKASFFSAYIEGWALYAEQLADEMGVYEADPWGLIGYLRAALLRAVRLVVDTGLHAKRWSREQAIRYFVDHLGDPEASAITEVERYCVWPGQACAYMLGKLTWLRLRDAAKTRMGAHFDIRSFHDAGLLIAPVPLTVLEGVIRGHIHGI